MTQSNLTWSQSPAGTFIMGSDSHYRDERPAYRVAVGSFDIDATAMTDLHSAEFVAYTGRNAHRENPCGGRHRCRAATSATPRLRSRRPFRFFPDGIRSHGRKAGPLRGFRKAIRNDGQNPPTPFHRFGSPCHRRAKRDQVLNMLAVPLPHRQEPVPTRRTCEMGNRNARGVADGAPSNPIPRVRSKPAGASGRSRRVARSEANGSPKNLLGGPDT